MFTPLDASRVDISRNSERAQEWKATKELLSCLQPDLEEILWLGKLDREAMSDWCDFMNKATSTVYSRNANLWGFVGYYLVLLEALAQGVTDQLDAIFEYLCRSVVRQNYMATKHSSMINQFVLAMHTCRTSCAANPLTAEDRAIFWHNYRTTEKPEGPFHHNVQFTAIRLESVCHVIKKVMNLTFKPEEIRRTVEECQWAFFGRAKFYNVEMLGYPPTKTMQDETTCAVLTVPLSEDELLAGHLKLDRAIFFKTSKIQEITTEVDNVLRDSADYKTIVIKSANPSIGNYNFYEAVTMRTDESWYGFRGLGSTNFGKFCGIQNEILNMNGVYITGMNDICRQEGYADVEEVFKPSNLLKHYAYTHFVNEAKLPGPLRYDPFVYRNAEDDHPMPDCERSMQFYEELQDDYDDMLKEASASKKRGRDHELRSGGSAVQQFGGKGSNHTLGQGVTDTPLDGSPELCNETDAGEDLMEDDEEEVRSE